MIQDIIESLSSEQQQSIEILLDNISYSSAAVSSLDKGPGSLTIFTCRAVVLQVQVPVWGGQLKLLLTVTFRQACRLSCN